MSAEFHRAAVLQVVDWLMSLLHEALHSFHGGQFLGYRQQLKDGLEQLAKSPKAYDSHVAATLERLLVIVDEARGAFFLNEADPPSRRWEVARRRLAFGSAFCEQLKILIECSPDYFEFGDKLEPLSHGGGRDQMLSLLDGSVDRLKTEVQIQADVLEEPHRRLVLRDAQAFFWYRSGQVRWALTSLEHTVDRVRELKSAELSRDIILSRALVLRLAAKAAIPSPHTLMGIEIRNRGEQEADYPAGEGVFHLCLRPEEIKSGRSQTAAQPNENLILAADCGRSGSSLCVRDQLRIDEDSLSDDTWEYSLNSAVVQPGTVFNGIVVFESEFDTQSICECALRHPAQSYHGGNVRRYLFPK